MGLVSFYTEEGGLMASPLNPVNPINYLKLILGGGGPLTDNGLGTNGMIRTNVSTVQV